MLLVCLTFKLLILLFIVGVFSFSFGGSISYLKYVWQ